MTLSPRKSDGDAELERFKALVAGSTSTDMGWQGWLSILGLIIAVAALLIAPLPGCMLACLSVYGWVSSSAAARRERQRHQAELTQLLTSARKAHLIGPLIDLRYLGITPIHVGLIHLLPQMEPSGAQRLNSRQWSGLYSLLQGKDEEMALAVLQAISRCGNVGALPYVEALEHGRGTARQNNRIRAMAQQCAECLRERIACLDQPRTLLRGSAAPTDDTLLHPVQSVPDIPPEQLLRASEETLNPDNPTA